MGEPSAFEREKLVIGILYSEETVLNTALSELIKLYGQIDSRSDSYSFSDFSRFYDLEMHGSVRRQFFSFAECVDPSELAEIKLRTNQLEKKFTVDGDRRINLDPGLISHGKYVMATTKSASFRIPLSEGIYAELSLCYSRKSWHDFYWTYHDIKMPETKAYLETVRDIYLDQRKQWIRSK